MASLTPGILLKLLEHIGSDSKVECSHRSAFLQVIGIVPAIAESDHLWPRHGFYIKVSDSSHCTYMSLAEEHDDLILSNKLQLGQLIQVDKLDPGSPVPILASVCPVSGKHPFVGTPQEISPSDSCDFLCRSVAHHRLGLPPDATSERRRSLGSENRVAIEKPAEKAVSWKCPEFSGSKVYPSPSNKLIPGRRSVERSSWSIVGAPLPNRTDKKDDAQGQASQMKVLPEFSPVLQYRSVSALPARDYSVRSSLFFEKGILNRCDSAPLTVKGSPDVRRSFQKTTISTAGEALSRYKQVSPGVKRAASVGKVGQKANTEQGKINPLRKSVSKRSAAETQMNGIVLSDEKTMDVSSKAKHIRDENHCKDKVLSVSLPEQPNNAHRDAKPETVMLNVNSKNEWCSPPRCIRFEASISRDDTKSCNVDALPAALATLRKKALQRRFVASYAASEALQEASSTQSIIQSLSNFEELCSTARPENPGPVVQEFLRFHRTLLEASCIVHTLANSRQLNVSSASENEDTLLDASRRARIILDERGQSAISWVNAALSSGLSPCPSWNKDPKPPKSPPKEIFDGKCRKNKMGSFNSPARGISKPPFFPLSSASNAQDRTLTSSPATKPPEDEGCCKKSKTMESEHSLKELLDWELEKKKLCLNMDTSTCFGKGGACVLLDWANGYGCMETLMMAKQLQGEAEAWFLRFLDKALDSGFKFTIKEAAARKKNVDANNPWPDNNNQVSAVLSDLKSVNDWLDHIIVSRRKSLNPGLEETTTKLKQKLYDLLIQLVLRSPSQMVSQNLC